MLTKKKIQTTIALVFGILILVNILSYRFFLRLDFTADHRYSLSNATKNILKNLDATVTVTAYFTENLPPRIQSVRNDFKDLLIEYVNYSDGQVVYDFVNPNKDTKTEMEAQRAGVRPIMINVREKDQMKQQRAYLGAVVQYKEKKETIPFIQPGTAMEYALTSAIKKLTVKSKPEVDILQGEGEPSLDELQQLHALLNVMYTVKELTFTDTSGVPPQTKVLMIIAPQDSFKQRDFKYLDQFVKRGGKVLAALNRVKGDLSKQQGDVEKTNIFDWIKKFGVRIDKDFIVDVNCTNVMVRQQQGMFIMNTPVRFPYVPIITRFTKHPITEGLEEVMMPFVSPVYASPEDTTIKTTVLARTSEQSGVQTPPVYFDVTKQWRKTDFLKPSIPVAVALEGKLLGGTLNRMVVFGDGDFATNGKGNNAKRLGEDNISLMANAVDWLSDDTGLIELRTKGITSRPLNVNISESTKIILKYANFLMPIILIILYGVIRFQRKRKIRKQIQSVDYV